MSTLVRLFDFLPGTPIVSSAVDSEFNQLVNALNGTSTNINLLTRFSSASVPVQRYDQLSSGPIIEFAQSGVLKSSINNLGQFDSDIATGTSPFSIASTTVNTNLNADLLDGLHAAAFATLAASQTFTGNNVFSGNNIFTGLLSIINAAPEIVFTDNNDSATIRLALDFGVDAFNIINNNLVSIPLSLKVSTDVFTFAQIPVLPGSNPSTGNQATRKTYVDTRFTYWSATFGYVNPPGATESVESVPRFVVAAGMAHSFVFNAISVVFAGGSHTSGGTLTWTIKRRDASGTLQSDLGTITIDNSGPAIQVVSATAPGNVSLSAGDQIYPLLTTRSGTITEEMVSIVISGFQQLA